MTARDLINDLDRCTGLDLPESRVLRLAFAYAKIAQWSILQGNTAGAERNIAAALKCLKLSRAKRQMETVS